MKSCFELELPLGHDFGTSWSSRGRPFGVQESSKRVPRAPHQTLPIAPPKLLKAPFSRPDIFKSTHTMDNHKGVELKFQSKDWNEKLEDEEFKEHCYKMICDKVILKYTKADLGIDDVEITNEVLGD